MTHPDDDALAAIALGDPAPSGAAEHARSCPECSQTLTALRDTVTTLRAPQPALVAPPASVWDAVEAELDREPDAAPAAPASVAPLPVAHPPAALAPPPAPDAGDELSRRRSSRSTRRRFPLAWVAGAAAAGLVVGVVGARALQGEQADPVTTVASTRLDTLDTRQVRGTADVVEHDGRLDLQVTTKPMDTAGGYLEVWLINKDLKRMVSLGVLEPGTKNQPFVIPQDLLDQGYVIVDISREGLDGSPQHSGQSLMRGTLAT
ncbi:MAG: anti-sigma factor [Ornithinibacter sp.]